MSLIGVSLNHGTGPVAAAFLPMGDLTVLMGQNDSGKTRLLAEIAAALNGGHANCTFFVEPSAPDEDLKHRIEGPTMFVPFSSGEIASHGQDAEGEQMRTRLAEQIRAAADRPILALSADEAGVGWKVEPCTWPEAADGDTSAGMPPTVLPPLARSLGTSYVTLLPQPIRVPCTDAELLEAVSRTVTQWVSHLAAVEQDYPVRLLETIDDAERGQDANDAEWWTNLLDSVVEVGSRHRAAKTLSSEILLDTEESGLAAKYSEKTLRSVEFVARVANTRLPKFVGERYVLRLGPVPVPELSAGRTLAIKIDDRFSGRAYNLDAAADGHRMWFQIAVLEGIDALRVLQTVSMLKLMRVASACWSLAQASEELGYARYSYDRENEASPGVIPQAESEVAQASDAVARARRRLETATHEYEALLTQLLDWDWDARSGEERLAERQAGALEWERADEYFKAEVMHLRPLVYLIDEPERHLHPRLIGSAARWLASVVRENRTQAVIVTHAPAFLTLGGDTRYAQVRRNDASDADVVPFAPVHLTALSEMAADLGLNRGQLLATTTLVVFVEGRHDQRLFEALFLERLHSAGIVLVPISGVARHQGIIDSEMMLRYVACPTVAMFDSVTHDEIARLRRDSDFRREARQAGRSELSAASQLFENAAEYGRDIEVVGVPAMDIFDLLDDDVLAAAYPKWPGQQAANLAWLGSKGKNPNRKTFYFDRYGVPAADPNLYARMGDRMRLLGSIPQSLDAVMDELEYRALVASANPHNSA